MAERTGARWPAAARQPPARGSSRSTNDVDGQSVGSASGGAVGARSRRGLYRGEAVDPQKKKSSGLDLKTRVRVDEKGGTSTSA